MLRDGSRAAELERAGALPRTYLRMFIRKSGQPVLRSAFELGTSRIKATLLTTVMGVKWVCSINTPHLR
jgi:hypothetical protein